MGSSEYSNYFLVLLNAENFLASSWTVSFCKKLVNASHIAENTGSILCRSMYIYCTEYYIIAVLLVMYGIVNYIV
jgi:hypothetical protein